MQRSMRWAKRSKEAFTNRPGYGIFGIQQGNVFKNLREESANALKEIGFDEVKISRNIVNHIDSDRQRLNDVKGLLNNIKTLGLKASVVGVENIDQYLLLKEIDDTALMQGFYLHHPLDKQALIEAIRGSNRKAS